MRRAKQCRIRHAVCRRAAVTRAPRSRARLRPVRLAEDPWRSHVHRTYTPQAGQSFKLQTANVQGRGGRPSPFSGGFKGGILFGKRIPPLARSSAVGAAPPPALAKREKKSSLAAALFHFSQMTGLRRSASTKALAFSTASARGSLTCSPVRISLQDTTPALISSSPRK